MAPTVILIRHAQAQHNATNYNIHDPALTELGISQCATLRDYLKKFDLAQKIELIVASPMRRTVQTAQETMGWLMEKGVPVSLRAEWQENSAKPCDTGTDIAVISKEWSKLDWSNVDPVFPSKTGLYEFSKDGLTRRGIEARRWLKNRPEKVIAVVSHAGFLRVGVSYCQYDNADFRVFEFAEGGEDDAVGGRLVEWELTEERGGGLGKSLKGKFGWETQTFPEIDENGNEIERVPREEAENFS